MNIKFYFYDSKNSIPNFSSISTKNTFIFKSKHIKQIKTVLPYGMFENKFYYYSNLMLISGYDELILVIIC